MNKPVSGGYRLGAGYRASGFKLRWGARQMWNYVLGASLVVAGLLSTVAEAQLRRPVIEPGPVSPASEQVSRPLREAEPVCSAEALSVYFEFNADRLEAPERERLLARVSTDQNCAPNTARVSGHTDRSGSASYNERLALRRASYVRAVLVQQGLASAHVEIDAFGERQPAVVTADGVREPLNRRVEVVLEARPES